MSPPPPPAYFQCPWCTDSRGGVVGLHLGHHYGCVQLHALLQHLLSPGRLLQYNLPPYIISFLHTIRYIQIGICENTHTSPHQIHTGICKDRSFYIHTQASWGHLFIFTHNQMDTNALFCISSQTCRGGQYDSTSRTLQGIPPQSNRAPHKGVWAVGLAEHRWRSVVSDL